MRGERSAICSAARPTWHPDSTTAEHRLLSSATVYPVAWEQRVIHISHSKLQSPHCCCCSAALLLCCSAALLHMFTVHCCLLFPHPDSPRQHKNMDQKKRRHTHTDCLDILGLTTQKSSQKVLPTTVHSGGLARSRVSLSSSQPDPRLLSCAFSRLEF